MKQLFANNAVSLLATGIGQSDTALTVLPGHGALFPSPGENEFFTVTLEDQAALVQEIIHVIFRDGDLFHIKRAQEGTTARAWSASQGNDTLVDHRITAATLDRLANNTPSIPSTPGDQVVDGDFTYAVDGNSTFINLEAEYKPGSTAVYVGGARQKRGVDFYEVGPTLLRLQFPIGPDEIEDGQNIVVDYIVA